MNEQPSCSYLRRVPTKVALTRLVELRAISKQPANPGLILECASRSGTDVRRWLRWLKSRFDQD